MAKGFSLYPTKSTGANTPDNVTGTDLPGDKFGMDVTIGGGMVSATPSGLSIAGRITEVTLSSGSWTPLPASPLTDRNAITIQNTSGTEIKLNYDSGEAGYVGVVVGNGGERYYDITDSIIIYAKAASGTPTIVVEEIS